MDKIPHIIHQTWKDADLPLPYKVLADTWKEFHPDWEYILWTDDMNRDFISENFPEFLDKYDSYPINIQRVDAFRYCVLSKMGGLYVDLDCECLSNIDNLLENQRCVMGKEPDLHANRLSKNMIICNALMACVQNDRFMNAICEKVFSYVKVEVEESMDVLNSTGPLLLTDCYLSYDSKHEVQILDSSYFYPITMFETNLILQENVPQELQRKIDNAYAVHYFLSNW